MKEKNDTRRIVYPQPPDVGMWPPPPPPIEQQNWVLFDFYIGQKVTTIYGETGFVECLSMGRSGAPVYLVQKSMDKSEWLHFDQIEQDRWEPWCGTDGLKDPVYAADAGAKEKA